MIDLDYLGYRFSFPDVVSSSHPVDVSIADGKVKKLKTRLVRSLLDYAQTADSDLLEKRIAYLTGNHIVKGSKDGGKLKAGIYFSYPLITNLKVLDALTNFLRGLLNARVGAFAAKVSAKIDQVTKVRLSKYSFRAGYKNRRLRNFTAQEIRAIQRCWHYGQN